MTELKIQAWGTGMQESNLAEQAIKKSKVRKRKKIKGIKAGKVDVETLLENTYDEFEKTNEGFRAVLAVAESLSKSSVLINPGLDVIRASIMMERRPSSLKLWNDPWKRKRDLEDFMLDLLKSELNSRGS